MGRPPSPGRASSPYCGELVRVSPIFQYVNSAPERHPTGATSSLREDQKMAKANLKRAYYVRRSNGQERNAILFGAISLIIGAILVVLASVRYLTQ